MVVTPRASLLVTLRENSKQSEVGVEYFRVARNKEKLFRWLIE